MAPHRLLIVLSVECRRSPYLFTFYMADISIIMQSFGLNYHNYTYHNQIYSSWFPVECAFFKTKVIDCCRQVDGIQSADVKPITIGVSMLQFISLNSNDISCRQLCWCHIIDAVSLMDITIQASGILSSDTFPDSYQCQNQSLITWALLNKQWLDYIQTYLHGTHKYVANHWW